MQHGDNTVEVPFNVLLGCDGGGSRVRYAMKEQGHTTFSEALLGSGYKEVGD
jgi:hypothetical protein